MIGQHINVSDKDDSLLTQAVIVGGMLPTGCCSDAAHYLAMTHTNDLMVVVDRGFGRFYPCSEIMKH